MNEEVLLRREKPSIYPAVFEDIDDSMIKKVALKTNDGSGPSGLDADGWRKILVSKSYGTINSDLRRAFANIIKNIGALKWYLLTKPKTKHCSKHFWLADLFLLTKIQDYDQSE